MARVLKVLAWLIITGVIGSQLVFPVQGAFAQSRAINDGRVVLVIVDRISWQELMKADMPVFKELAAAGAVGLMTTNPAAGIPRTPASTFATIGAGAKISGGDLGGAAFNIFEPYENDTAGQAFFRRTGIRPVINQVVHLGIAQMDKSNSELKYQYVPGALGAILHNNGLKTAVIGNSDVPGGETKYSRQAVSIAMDNLGIVDYGNVSGSTYVSDPNVLARVKTDYEVLKREFNNLRNTADLIVIDTGDTSRIDDMREVATDEVIASHINEALSKVDGFLGEIKDKLDFKKDLLMFVVPGPSREALAENSLLTPFAIVGRGIDAGLVWSGTVKRDGFISNTDIAAAIVNNFGLEGTITSEESADKIILGGQVIKGHPSGNPFQEITVLGDDAFFLHISRSPLLRGYLNLALTVIILSTVLILIRSSLAVFIVPFLAGVTVIPGVMLWGNYFPKTSIAASGLGIFGTVILITAVLLFLTRNKPHIFYLAVTGLTMIMLIFDLLAGAPLGKTSPFSYDVLAGARFYGIGNEFMGIFIGSALVFIALAADSLKTRFHYTRLLAAVLFPVIIYLIAAPNFGTNVGGFMSAVAGFGTAGFLLFRERVKKFVIIAGAGILAAVVIGFAALDVSNDSETQSHIGRTITLIGQSGFSEIVNIVSRKWAINIKLIRYSTWSWVYFAGLLSVIILKKALPRHTAHLALKNPWFDKLLAALLVGSAAALIFNDSGVVAAANMVIYAVAAFLTEFIYILHREEV